MIRVALILAACAAPVAADPVAEALDLCEAAVRAGTPEPLAGLVETGRYASANGQIDIDFTPPGGAGQMMWKAEDIVFSDGSNPGLSRSCWLRLTYATPAERDAHLAVTGAWLDATLARGFQPDDGAALRRTRDCAGIAEGAGKGRPLYVSVQDRDWMQEVTAMIRDFGPDGPACKG